MEKENKETYSLEFIKKHLCNFEGMKYYDGNILPMLFESTYLDQIKKDNICKIGDKTYLSYDSNADFIGYAYDSFVSDGTLIFLYHSFARCFEKIFKSILVDDDKFDELEKIKKNLEMNKEYATHITIGNCCVFHEYSDKSFNVKNPFLHERTYTFIPVKFSLKKVEEIK